MSPLAPRVQALPQRFIDTNLDHHVPAGLIAPRSFKNPWPSDRSPLNPLMLANTFTDPAPSEKDIVDPQADDSDKDGHPVRNLGTTMMDEGKGHVRGMWLGHASFLILFPSRLSEREVGVLFDPVFEDRCSPSGWFGPIRDVKPPLDIASLPPIHLVFISHSHYDHLSHDSTHALWEHHSYTIHWIVPLGLKPWFVGCRIPEDRITECDWWDELSVEVPLVAESDGSADCVQLRVACTPCQHGSGRGLADKNISLWASWVVALDGPSQPVKRQEGEDDSDVEEMDEWTRNAPKKWVGEAMTVPKKATQKDWDETSFKVYFGGDTGYRQYGQDPTDEFATCPAFKQIATRYAPFSLTLLPISPGSSLPYIQSFLPSLPYPLSQLPLPKAPEANMAILTSHSHLTPADAIELWKVLGGGRCVGIHWGTWGGKEMARHARRWLWNEMRERGIPRRLEKGREGSFELWHAGEMRDLEEEAQDPPVAEEVNEEETPPKLPKDDGKRNDEENMSEESKHVKLRRTMG